MPDLSICDGGTCKVDVGVNVNWGGSAGGAGSTSAHPVSMAVSSQTDQLVLMSNGRLFHYYNNIATDLNVVGIVSLSGGAYPCSIDKNGVVECFTICGDTDISASIIPVSNVRKIKSCGGNYSACAILNNGSVKQWTVVDQDSDPNDFVINDLGVSNAVDVSSSGPPDRNVPEVVSYCWVLNDGTVWCQGSNYAGQLGNGSTLDSSTPVQVTGISTAGSITAGGSNYCAVLTDGSAKCWGDNSNGQLGNGTTTSSSIPVAISGLSNVESISLTSWGGFALLATGAVSIWGNAPSGYNVNQYGLTPVPLVLSGVLSLDTDGSLSIGVVTTTNDLFLGYLGSELPMTLRTLPKFW
jgi:hypothetical protein